MHSERLESSLTGLACLGVQGQAGVNVLVSKDGKAKTTIAVDFARELVMVDATSEGNDAVRAGPLLGDKTSVSVHAYIDHSIVGAPYHTSTPSYP